MLRRLLLLLALVALPLAAVPSAAQEDVSFGKGEVTVVTKDGQRDRFQVELATTAPQMERGLMFRKELAADAGMLFVFPSARMTAFWMKNTLIPLDMLFIAEDGRVVHVAQRTTPLSTESISSRRPVIAVLELSGGTAERLGITTGATVESKALP